MSGGHSDPEAPEPAGEKAGTEGDGEGVVYADAQMQNAKCRMQNEITVGGGALKRKCKMQNAECRMRLP